MKKFKVFIFLIIGCSVFAQTDDLELIVVENSSYNTFDLKIKNNSNKTVTVLKARDFNFVIDAWNPTVEFVAEVFEDGKWRKLKKEKERLICGNSLHVKASYIQIQPKQEVAIGRHPITYVNIEDRFYFLDDARARFFFVYTIDKQKKENVMENENEEGFEKLGLKEVRLESNKIEFDYKNKLSKKQYSDRKQRYINKAFSDFINQKYSSKDILQKLKRITNKNGVEEDILNEVLNGKNFKYLGSFTGYPDGETNRKYKYRGIVYEVNGKIHFGIYAGKHYLMDVKDKKAPLEYYFGEFEFNPKILENYLFKD